jgi:hypothetical protein
MILIRRIIFLHVFQVEKPARARIIRSMSRKVPFHRRQLSRFQVLPLLGGFRSYIGIYLLKNFM